MNVIESQPPAVNFVTVTTTSTRPVATAPMMLMTIDRRQPRAASAPLCCSRSQCTIIPLCDSVNEVNTPMT